MKCMYRVPAVTEPEAIVCVPVALTAWLTTRRAAALVWSCPSLTCAAVGAVALAVTTALQMVRFGPDENAHVQACAVFSQAHRGAAQRTAEVLLPYLKTN